MEHYEIAGYGTVAAWARVLGLEDVVELLEQTLQEEKAADEKLTEVNADIIAEAGAEVTSSEEEDEGEAVGAGPQKKGSSNRSSDSKSKRRTG